MAVKTKAEIVTNLIIDEKTLASLEKVQGNVYIVNQNTGSIYVQTNLTECLCVKLKQGAGLKAIMDEIRQLIISMALTESKNITQAAKKLKITTGAIYHHRPDLAGKAIEYKKAPIENPRPDLEINEGHIVKNDNLLE
jgi:hypothetical protein